MVEDAGDGHGADATDDRGDSGEVGARADIFGEVAFQYSAFGGGASIDDDATGRNHIRSDETGDAGGGDDEIVIS